MSRAYETSRIAVSPRGVNAGLHIRYSDIKVLEQSLSNNTEYVMTPSNSVLEAYERFIARAVTYAHRDQLNHESHGYQGVGFAFGNLYRSVKADLASRTSGSWHNHTLYVGFTYDLELNRYGEVLDEGRSAAYIPIEPLIHWIRMKKGVLNASVGSSPQAIKSFAYAISRSNAAKSRPAYLPGWTELAQGTSTERSFNDYYQRNKKYYVGLLTNDVMSRLAQVNK